jgi:hypothetical protein
MDSKEELKEVTYAGANIYIKILCNAFSMKGDNFSPLEQVSNTT